VDSFLDVGLQSCNFSAPVVGWYFW